MDTLHQGHSWLLGNMFLCALKFVTDSPEIMRDVLGIQEETGTEHAGNKAGLRDEEVSWEALSVDLPASVQPSDEIEGVDGRMETGGTRTRRQMLARSMIQRILSGDVEDDDDQDAAVKMPWNPSVPGGSCYSLTDEDLEGVVSNTEIALRTRRFESLVEESVKDWKASLTPVRRDRYIQFCNELSDKSGPRVFVKARRILENLRERQKSPNTKTSTNAFPYQIDNILCSLMFDPYRNIAGKNMLPRASTGTVQPLRSNTLAEPLDQSFSVRVIFALTFVFVMTAIVLGSGWQWRAERSSVIDILTESQAIQLRELVVDSFERSVIKHSNCLRALNDFGAPLMRKELAENLQVNYVSSQDVKGYPCWNEALCWTTSAYESSLAKCVTVSDEVQQNNIMWLHCLDSNTIIGIFDEVGIQISQDDLQERLQKDLEKHFDGFDLVIAIKKFNFSIVEVRSNSLKNGDPSLLAESESGEWLDLKRNLSNRALSHFEASILAKPLRDGTDFAQSVTVEFAIAITIVILSACVLGILYSIASFGEKMSSISRRRRSFMKRAAVASVIALVASALASCVISGHGAYEEEYELTQRYALTHLTRASLAFDEYINQVTWLTKSARMNLPIDNSMLLKAFRIADFSTNLAYAFYEFEKYGSNLSGSVLSKPGNSPEYLSLSSERDCVDLKFDNGSLSYSPTCNFDPEDIPEPGGNTTKIHYWFHTPEILGFSWCFRSDEKVFCTDYLIEMFNRLWNSSFMLTDSEYFGKDFSLFAYTSLGVQSPEDAHFLIASFDGKVTQDSFNRRTPIRAVDSPISLIAEAAKFSEYSSSTSKSKKSFSVVVRPLEDPWTYRLESKGQLRTCVLTASFAGQSTNFIASMSVSVIGMVAILVFALSFASSIVKTVGQWDSLILGRTLSLGKAPNFARIQFDADLTLEEHKRAIRPLVMAACGLSWQRHRQGNKLSAEEALEHLHTRAAQHIADVSVHKRSIVTVCHLEQKYPTGPVVPLYRFRTNLYVRRIVLVITFLHILLTFAKPGTLEDMRSEGVRPVVLAIELCCIIVEVSDLVLRLWLKYGTGQPSFRKVGSSSDQRLLFDVCQTAVIFSILNDWILQLCFNFSFEYVVPLRAALPFFVQKTLRLALSTFIHTLLNALNVLGLYLAIVITATVMGLVMFLGDPSQQEISNPNDLSTYDNFFRSFLSSFIYISTGENYTSVVFRAFQANEFYAIYFVFFALIGTFFVVAMVISMFQIGFHAEKIARDRRMKMLDDTGLVAAFILLDVEGSGKVSWEMVMRVIKQVFPHQTRSQLSTSCSLKCISQSHSRRPLNVESFVRLFEELNSSKVTSKDGGNDALRRTKTGAFRASWKQYMLRVFFSYAFHMFIQGLIIAYIFLMSLYGAVEKSYLIVLDSTLTVIYVVFVLELLMKLVCLGLYDYWNFSTVSSEDDAEEVMLKNRMDLIVIVMSVLLFILGFSIGRISLRLGLSIVVLKIFQELPALRRLVLLLVITLPPFASLISLLFLCIYVYAVVGAYLFASRISTILPSDEQPTGRFDSVANAFMTEMQLFIGEGWHELMYAGIRSSSFPHAFYFMSYIVLVTILFANLLVGVILDLVTRIKGKMVLRNSTSGSTLTTDRQERLQ